MSTLTRNKISLYKELQVIQESPDGARIIYNCYEAIPNGGFCVISDISDTKGHIQIKPPTYTKNPLPLLSKIDVEFFPTLIDAITAYNPQQ